jgi:hypothetical protein
MMHTTAASATVHHCDAAIRGRPTVIGTITTATQKAETSADGTAEAAS